MKEPIPIAVIYALPDEKGNFNVASQLTKHARGNKYDTIFVSCACVSLYESFLSHVPECHQNEFEEIFQQTFARVFEVKESYTEIFKIEDPDDDPE